MIFVVIQVLDIKINNNYENKQITLLYLIFGCTTIQKNIDIITYIIFKYNPYMNIKKYNTIYIWINIQIYHRIFIYILAYY